MSASEKKGTTVLRLRVKNHPGVMSHVCGLFARRAYNVEAILCLPVGEGAESLIWLKVAESDRCDQIVKQLRKLADVRIVENLGAGTELFAHVARAAGTAVQAL